MIYSNVIVTVNGKTSRISEPIYLYRGDREVEVIFTIMQSAFKFSKGENLITSTDASYGQLIIDKPTDEFILSAMTKCEDGKVKFKITREMIDELEELGLYTIQIRLFDESRRSRITIPEVEGAIEVLEPIAEFTDEVEDGEVEEGEDVGDIFNEDGSYNQTIWMPGDKITDTKLNKIEDAIFEVNEKVEDIEVPSLEGYATEEYVDTAIANIDIPEVDLTGYATEEYVGNKYATKAELEGYATEDYVGNKYVNKAELEGYATEEYVGNKYVNKAELESYATEDYVDTAIANIDIPEDEAGIRVIGGEEEPHVFSLADIPDVEEYYEICILQNVNLTFLNDNEDELTYSFANELVQICMWYDEDGQCVDIMDAVWGTDLYLRVDEDGVFRLIGEDYLVWSGEVDGLREDMYNFFDEVGENYATTEYVDTAVANIDIPEVDTSNLISTDDILIIEKNRAPLTVGDVDDSLPGLGMAKPAILKGVQKDGEYYFDGAIANIIRADIDGINGYGLYIQMMNGFMLLSTPNDGYYDDGTEFSLVDAQYYITNGRNNGEGDNGDNLDNMEPVGTIYTDGGQLTVSDVEPYLQEFGRNYCILFDGPVCIGDNEFGGVGYSEKVLLQRLDREGYMILLIIGNRYWTFRARTDDWDNYNGDSTFILVDNGANEDNGDNGSGNIDLSAYALKDSPVFFESISLGRKVDTKICTGSFAVGNNVEASEYCAHAEGNETTASGGSSHAEGYRTTASGNTSHAEGNDTAASGDSSHAEGSYTTAEGSSSHAEGGYTRAKGLYSHAEGCETIANRFAQHVQGKFNLDNNADYAHIVGNGINEDERSNAHTLDWQGNAWYQGNIFVGGTSAVDGKKLATEDYVTDAIANIDIPEGGGSGNVDLSAYAPIDSPNFTGSISLGRSSYSTVGKNSFAVGNYVTASGECSHAEGGSTASGQYSHAEGYSYATGHYSHSEGASSTASGQGAHVEGGGSMASGQYSHAEGQNTYARKNCSHSEGLGTTADSLYQHVQGKYNIEDSAGKYAHIVGNGDASHRSNAHTLDWNGNAWYQGNVYVGGTSQDDGKKVATEEFVMNAAMGGIDMSNLITTDDIPVIGGESTTHLVTVADVISICKNSYKTVLLKNAYIEDDYYVHELVHMLHTKEMYEYNEYHFIYVYTVNGKHYKYRSVDPYEDDSLFIRESYSAFTTEEYVNSKLGDIETLLGGI